ncbi:MAG: hypothetical protein QF903_04880 [Planctomycetota bacterium]|jgi:hypothetical protein|nr:hypothetical protein [Planctomycetota bacterium]MDP6763362.1 hypothetical protein [Planctomycetota bacterium]MDP6988791.1 hypothetical protein [Planctomycetota bacterium]
MAKRKYNRRTDEQLIEDLQSKIQKVQERLESKQRKDSPVLKKLKHIESTLRKFAELSLDHDRPDLANMVTAFLAGLRRAAEEGGTPAPPRRSVSRTDVETNVDVDA